MKKSMNNLIIPCVLLALFTLASFAGVMLADNDSKTFTIKNNSTRDYNYEHYCDSIYMVNPDYYNDIIVESDKFQQYVDEHGEWWTN